MITRDQAWVKVNELIKNQNLVKHCLAVEAAMRGYYDYFVTEGRIPGAVTHPPRQSRGALSRGHIVRDPEAERELWGISGLIHDADWEGFPDKHPGVIVEWLKEQGVSDDLINAVEAHG